MNANDIRARILELVEKELERAGLNAADVEDDLDLLDSGVVDSFGFVNFCMQLEEEFGVEVDIGEFTDDDAPQRSALVNLVLNKRGDS